MSTEAQPAPGQGQLGYDQPLTYGQFRWYMDGMQHARDAMLFGVLSIFTIGVLFGPLALIEARRAEQFGIPARAGKVLGWIGIGLFALWILVFAAYVAFFIAVVIHLPDWQRGSRA
jgi:hypothetical protein